MLFKSPHSKRARLRKHARPGPYDADIAPISDRPPVPVNSSFSPRRPLHVNENTADFLRARGRRAQARAWRIASYTRWGVTGSDASDTPRSAKASHTALAMAAPRPGLPHSPSPRSPSGFVVARISW